MSHEISEGIAEAALESWLSKAAKQYGTFEDGRVNYTHAPIAPVVMCTILWYDKILLLKRAMGLADAEGYWSTVNGFIDEPKPVKLQVILEVREELSLEITDEHIKVGQSYTMKQSNEKRSYIVFPCLVTLISEPVIKLDYENTEFTWINREELPNFHILDDLPYTIDQALSLR